jgi:hypothetical protein
MDDDGSRAWFGGVDWASQDRHAVVVGAAGRELGEGLAALAAWIPAFTEAEPDTVAVAIEAPAPRSTRHTLQRSSTTPR